MAHSMQFPNPIILDGETLTPEALYHLSFGKTKIDLSSGAWEKVAASRVTIDSIVARNIPVYGINTGFGNFANISIPADKIDELQKRLIMSHAAGTGQPLSIERTRMLLALRINVLARGRSGIRPETLKIMLYAFNNSLLSYVPEQGTVGASGDLAPLAHLALGLLGMGKMWNPTTSCYEDAAKVLKDHNCEAIELKAKEGLAMINGTQFMGAFASEAVSRAALLAKQADVISALTLEVLHGTPRAMDARIHEARPHPGQNLSASRIRGLLTSNNASQRPSEAIPMTFDDCSELFKSHEYSGRIQDPYTLRCIPQVHGVAVDTIEFCHKIIQTELNSSTDNPMVFSETNESISGGNFHGEYVAKALDFLAIGVHELSSMSERRTDRLVNGSCHVLPSFLVNEGGLNSGFMILHCTAAALVSENKVLCHPGSVDSIPTSKQTEDHVSMGGFCGRKAVQVVGNVEKVLAIELLAACQALEFHRPLKTTPPLEAVYSLVRKHVQAWTKDQFAHPDIEAVSRLLYTGEVWDAVQPYL
ncbi:hypothetical protein HDU83_003809 [Entophlyctis luteolus]|nr:hypothetical protein HDU83_003809 [Entophlyctis luteolus]